MSSLTLLRNDSKVCCSKLICNKIVGLQFIHNMYLICWMLYLGKCHPECFCICIRYEHQPFVSCLAGLYGCQWRRYQRARAQPGECCCSKVHTHTHTPSATSRLLVSLLIVQSVLITQPVLLSLACWLWLLFLWKNISMCIRSVSWF